MSTSSAVSLGALRQAAQERSDNENNNAITSEAWNQFITQSYKTIYNMLVSAYGNDYYVATTYQFQLSNSQTYPFPDGSPSFLDVNGNQATKFWKLLGVDLQYSSSPTGWVTLKRFEWIERNKFAWPNTAINWFGYTNLRYTVQGNNLYVVPVPMAGQVARIFYVPAPTNLQFRLPAYSNASSNVIGSITDTTGLTIGMNITGSAVPANTTISAVGSTTVTLSQNANSTLNQFLISAWNDNTLIDGIAGWEEFVIIDAAIKAQGKQENDTTQLFAEREAMVQEIEAMAEARDLGQAFHVSDVLGSNAYGGSGYDGMGNDGGWGDQW